jgi:exoribonuclease R
MARSDQRAHVVDRAVVDATEAWLLTGQEGRDFSAVVLDAGTDKATIVLDAPAVRATCTGADLPVGERISARLEVADLDKRLVRFARAPLG